MEVVRKRKAGMDWTTVAKILDLQVYIKESFTYRLDSDPYSVCLLLEMSYCMLRMEME